MFSLSLPEILCFFLAHMFLSGNWNEVRVAWCKDRGVDIDLCRILLDKRAKCQLSPARIIFNEQESDRHALSEKVMKKVADNLCKGTIAITEIYENMNVVLNSNHCCLEEDRRSKT